MIELAQWIVSAVVVCAAVVFVLATLRRLFNGPEYTPGPQGVIERELDGMVRDERRKARSFDGIWIVVIFVAFMALITYQYATTPPG